MSTKALQMPLKILRQIDLAQQLFDLGHELIAAEMIVQVENYVDIIDDADLLKEAILDRLYRPAAQSIRNKDKFVLEILTLLHCRSNWKILKLSGPMLLSYVQPSSDILPRYKLEGLIRCPMIYVLAAFKEADLYQFWLPACISSSIVSKTVKENQITKIVLSFFSIFQRELLIIQSHFGEVLSDGSLFLQARSTEYREGHSSGSRSSICRAEVLAGITLKEQPGAYLYVFFPSYKRFECFCCNTNYLIQDLDEKSDPEMLFGEAIDSNSKVDMKLVYRVDPKFSYAPNWMYGNYIL
jgi:hypothetical protein